MVEGALSLFLHHRLYLIFATKWHGAKQTELAGAILFRILGLVLEFELLILTFVAVVVFDDLAFFVLFRITFFKVDVLLCEKLGSVLFHLLFERGMP